MTTQLASVVRAFTFPGVTRAPADTTEGLRAWLVGGAGTVPANTASTLLKYFDQSEVAAALAFDANTYATKALESVDAICIVSKFPKASAWAAIKLYYAAFFSAVFLSRLCGRGTIYFDSQETSALNNMFVAYGNTAQLQRGSQRVSTDIMNSEIALNRVPRGLGVHEAVWAEFTDFLIDLEASVPTLIASTSEKAGITGSLEALRNALQRNGSLRGNWLSQFRNEINYRPQNRVWHPYKDARRLEELLRKLRSCEVDLDASKLHDVDQDRLFFATCSFLIGWTVSVVDDIAQRSAGVSTIYRIGRTELPLPQWP